MWIESLRLLPGIAREHHIAFCNGVALGLMGVAVVFGFAGFYLAAGLPPLLAGTLLFLTPISFLLSTARNARALVDNRHCCSVWRSRPSSPCNTCSSI